MMNLPFLSTKVYTRKTTSKNTEVRYRKTILINNKSHKINPHRKFYSHFTQSKL